MNPAVGVALSLTVAVFWSLSPIAHAAAARRIGAFPTLLWRSVFGSILLLVTALALGVSFPGPKASWVMILSGVVGVGVADILIYEAFLALGPRRTVQLLALGPAFTFLIALFTIGETVRAATLAGAVLVLSASTLAIWLERRAIPDGKEPGKMTRRGVLSAIGGAIIMGAAAVLARYAYIVEPDMNALAASVLRVGSATIFLWIVPVLRGKAVELTRQLQDRLALNRILIGTVFGPYLGMLAFVGAFKHLEAGLVMTLIALSPLVILPMVAFRYRTRIALPVIGVAAMAVAGVALIYLHP
jgi:drug/metabolite transporter (DMT)-like permease